MRFLSLSLVILPVFSGCLAFSSLNDDKKWDDASARARDQLEVLVERTDSPARLTGDRIPGHWVTTSAKFATIPEPALSFLYLAATDDFVTAHVKQLLADAQTDDCPAISGGVGNEKYIKAADCTASSGVRYEGGVDARWHELARGQYPESITFDNFTIEYEGVERRFSGFLKVSGQHYDRLLEMKMVVGVGENWFATTYARPLFSDDVSAGSVGVVPGVGSFQIRKGSEKTVEEGQHPVYAEGKEIHPGRPKTVATGSWRSLVGQDALDIEIDNYCYQMTRGRQVLHSLCSDDVAALMKLPSRSAKPAAKASLKPNLPVEATEAD